MMNKIESYLSAGDSVVIKIPSLVKAILYLMGRSNQYYELESPSRRREYLADVESERLTAILDFLDVAFIPHQVLKSGWHYIGIRLYESDYLVPIDDDVDFEFSSEED